MDVVGRVLVRRIFEKFHEINECIFFISRTKDIPEDYKWKTLNLLMVHLNSEVLSTKQIIFPEKEKEKDE